MDICLNIFKFTELYEQPLLRFSNNLNPMESSLTKIGFCFCFLMCETEDLQFKKQTQHHVQRIVSVLTELSV